MIVIGNGKVITRDLENPFLENGAVAVEGKRIVKVGTTQDILQAYPQAEYIDAQEMVIMPGFINAHHHIYSAFARGLNLAGPAPQNFLEILEHTWWHIDRNLNLNHVYHSALSTYLESIQNGVTFVSDHHASYGTVTDSLFAIEKAADKLGIRTCLAYEISERDGQEKALLSVKENFSFLNEVEKRDDKMMNAMIGLHASFTLSDEILNECQLRNNGHIGYHVHVAEGAYDEEQCQKHYGMSVVERLEKQGILGAKTVAGHCIHISEKDMDIIQRTNTMVVHNPESNMGNAVGTSDVITMLDKGIVVGLGTDGYTSDMLESLKTANLLQKHQRGLPDRGFSEACELLFDNNRVIAQRILNDTVGVLCEGALADIIIVNYHPTTPMNAQNINGHIMFGMQGAMTDTTMINGKIRMHNRKLVDQDEEEILRKSREAAKDLWSRL